MEFWHSCKKKFDRNRYIFVDFPITMLELTNFSWKTSFLQKIHWTCRLKFRLPRPKVFWHRTQKSRWMSESGNEKKIFSFQKGPSGSNYFYGQLECTFDIPDWKILSKTNIFSFKVRQWHEKSQVSGKKLFNLKIFFWR